MKENTLLYYKYVSYDKLEDKRETKKKTVKREKVEVLRTNIIALCFLIAALSTYVIVTTFDDFHTYTQYNFIFYATIFFSIFGFLISTLILISNLRKK